jgi:glycosidase
MMEVFKYWLEKGADGLRMQAANHIYETENFSNEIIVDINGDRTARANLVIRNSVNQVLLDIGYYDKFMEFR